MTIPTWSKRWTPRITGVLLAGLAALAILATVVRDDIYTPLPDTTPAAVVTPLMTPSTTPPNGTRDSSPTESENQSESPTPPVQVEPLSTPPSTPAYSPENDTATSSLSSTATSSEPHTGVAATTTASSTEQSSWYIEVVGGCDAAYNGSACVKAYAEPDKTAPIAKQLRRGVVLRILNPRTATTSGWYRVIFDAQVRYPERITSEWYIAESDNVRIFSNDGDAILTKRSATTTAHIYIDLSQQMLSAYDENGLFLETPISTGVELSPTATGTFTVFYKTPSRYMQGPIPDSVEQYYDMPGVPWNLYFTYDGSVIHGAYWHEQFGRQWSHGCVNVPTTAAHDLYIWAPVGTEVTIVE